ncbi:MAG: hypothetical protein H6Q71_2248 [Firmicutes bacterium]|nr:hypothetical protein [Bacillota bacterium]
MKLNYDFIRELLLAIEEKTDGIVNFDYPDIIGDRFPTISTSMIEYHIKFLHDAGFIQCPRSSHLLIIDITPIGRDYLDNVRNIDIWEKTKDTAKSLGPITLDVIREVAKALILGHFGLK